ncbi:MAG TPA: SDR family NAD(P)-dependent oxidoreductase [Microlunatus sp.]|jgi:NAD(P)-dependent dehydrogenase (short-subunit alcohol dehydrogenase family)
MEQVEKRVALVTGGNRGIGREICRQLSGLGYRVVVAARDRERATEAARDLDGWDHGDAIAVELDVTDAGSVRTAFEEAVKRFGAVDVLVNNAGIAIDGPDHRASLPELAKVQFTLETNLFGAWRCAVEAIPVMRARGYGRIVNLSSTLASLELTQTPGSPAYRVSKAGLNMLTRVLAAEVEHDGILVNAASPGYTRTDMSPDSDRPVEQGADTAVWLATLHDDGPTGGFFYERAPLAW